MVVCVCAQKHSVSILFTAFALNNPLPHHTHITAHLLFLHKLQGARATQEQAESSGRDNSAAASAAAAEAAAAAAGGGGGAAAEHGGEVGSVEHQKRPIKEQKTPTDTGGAGESDAAEDPESDVNLASNLAQAKLGQLHLALGRDKRVD